MEAKNIPLSFSYAGKIFSGIPMEFNPVKETKKLDDNRTQTTFTGTDSKGLTITAECVTYSDFAAYEWLIYFTNNGEQDTQILSDIKLNQTFTGTNPILYHGNGDTCRDDGYEWYRTPITENIKMDTHFGMSCQDAFPYMRILFEGKGVNIAIGWPGGWTAQIQPMGSDVTISIGQQRCHMKLLPGEKIRTPRLTVQMYEGSEDIGRNTWRKWAFKYIVAKENGKVISPKYCLHVWMANNMPEFTGATDENQISGLMDYINGGLRPDVWWIDAGWYKCDGNWPRVGTWWPDTERFPNGLKTIGDKCKEEGVGFLLWFEPERVIYGTQLHTQHPDWLLYADGVPGVQNNTGMLNLGVKECCDYMIQHVSNIINTSGITIYRQDFNFTPEPYWINNEAEDRIGALENFHQQGYLRYWDGLLENCPGLVMDSCASGGRRNDLDTMRRNAVSLHYTDVGYGIPIIKQKQHREMFEWIPYFRAHNMNWDYPDHRIDAYAFHTAMAPALTDMTSHNASPEAYAISRKMVSIWRKAALIMISGNYYPLTECRKNPEDVYAMQFHIPEEGRGFVQIVAGKDCAHDSYNLICEKLNPDKKYLFTDEERDVQFTYSGAELTSGICHKLEKRTGYLYFYEEIN